MGKYKHEGKGRNISVSGGQERKDLFKDMSGGYNAMGDSNQPLYKYNGSVAQQRYSSATPLEGNAFGHAMQKAGGDYDKAKSMLEMKGSHSPTYKKGCTSGSGSNAPYKKIGDPNKKMDRLSARHKSLYDRFEMGQTSEKEEQRMYRLEDKMDKVGKRINKKSSPASKLDPKQLNAKMVKPKFEKLESVPNEKPIERVKSPKKKLPPVSLMGPTKGKPGKSMSKKMRKLPRKKVE